MPKSAKKLIKLAAGFAVSVVLLLLLFSRIDTEAVPEVIAKARPGFLFASIACSLSVNVLLSAVQWKIALDALGLHLSLRENAFIKVALYPLRLIVPAKAGDLTRAAYLSVQHGFPAALGIGLTFFVTLGNMVVLLVLAMIGAVFAGIDGPLFFAIAATVGAGCVIVYAVLRWRYRTGRIPERLLPFRPVFLLPLRTVSTIFAFGAIGLFVHLFTFWFILLSLRIEPPFAFAMTATPLVYIAGNLPLTFMGIGTREAAVSMLFAQYANATNLLSAGLLLTLIDKLLSVAVGLFFFPRFAAACIPPKTKEKKPQRVTDKSS